MAVMKKCKVCKKEFETKPFYLKRGQGKYCSAKCHHEGMRTGKVKKCAVCGRETYRKLLQVERSKSGKYFCNKSCQTKWRNAYFHGEKHPNYTTGLYSYRSILDRHKVPAVCRLCKTVDRRILAVHHIDQNRMHNTASNLAWLCHNCHHLVHRYPDEKAKLKV